VSNSNDKPNPFANLTKALSKKNTPILHSPTVGTSAKTSAKAVQDFELKQSFDALEKYQFNSQPEKFSDDHVAIFKSQLSQLRASFGKPEIHENLLRTLAYLKSHTELKKILMPENINTMVQALQISYGATIEKRQSNKTATSKRKQKQNDIEEFMADMMGGL